MDVHVRSTTDGASLSYTLVGVGEASPIDDTDPDTHEQQDGRFGFENTTSGVDSYDVTGDLGSFEQTGGTSDWVLIVDGETVAFGGPEPSLTDGFAYATRSQIRSYVECVVEDRPTEEGVRSIVEDVLEDYDFDTGGGGNGPPGQGGWSPIPDHVWRGRRPTNMTDGTGILAVWSRSRGNLRYRIEGVGRADYYDDPNDEMLAGLPSNDDLTNRDDGTFAVEGYTGNEYGDAFAIDGYVTDFEVTDGASDWELETRGDVNVLDQYDGPTEGE